MADIYYIADGSVPPGSASYARAKANAANVPLNCFAFIYGGDVYNDGTAAEFTGSATGGYDAIYGALSGHDLTPVTAATPGNHDFHTFDAQGNAISFDNYWIAKAAQADQPITVIDTSKTVQARHDMSFTVNGWTILMVDTAQPQNVSSNATINSNGNFPASGPRWNWAQTVLKTTGKAKIICSHHGRWSSGNSHGDQSFTAPGATGATSATTDPLWQLAEGVNGAVAWIAGHDHLMERHVGRGPGGAKTALANGAVVQFISGAGGESFNLSTAGYTPAIDMARSGVLGFLKVSIPPMVNNIPQPATFTFYETGANGTLAPAVVGTRAVSEGALLGANQTGTITLDPNATGAFGGDGGSSPVAVAGYGFENVTAGTTIVDDVGSNDATAVNFSATPATMTSASGHGTALKFNGALQQRVEIPDANALDFTTGFTIAAWVNLDNSVDTDPLHQRYEIAEKSQSYWMNIREDSIPLYLVRVGGFFGGSAAFSETDSATAITPNTWTHVAGTYDGANLKIYINGVLNKTAAQVGNVKIGPEKLVIGAKHRVVQTPEVTEAFWNGGLDDVQFFNTALTVTQIQTVMATQLGGGGAGGLPQSDSFSRVVASGFSASDSGLTWTGGTSVNGSQGLLTSTVTGVPVEATYPIDQADLTSVTRYQKDAVTVGANTIIDILHRDQGSAAGGGAANPAPQTSATATSATNSVTSTLPNNLASGNLLVAQCEATSATANPTTTGAGWTLVGTSASTTGTAIRLAVYQKIAGAAEVAPVFTATGATAMHVTISRWTGASGVRAGAVAANAANTTNTVSVGGVAATAGDVEVMACASGTGPIPYVDAGCSLAVMPTNGLSQWAHQAAIANFEGIIGRKVGFSHHMIPMDPNGDGITLSTQADIVADKNNFRMHYIAWPRPRDVVAGESSWQSIIGTVVDPNSTFADMAAGTVTVPGRGKTYNQLFDQLGVQLAAMKVPIIFRPFWEVNVGQTGAGISWGVKATTAAYATYAANFIAAWRNLVTRIKAQASNVLFHWNPSPPNASTNNGAGSPSAWLDVNAGRPGLYPGDAYVDFVGPEMYLNAGESWNTQATKRVDNTGGSGGTGPSFYPALGPASSHNKMFACGEAGTRWTAGDTNASHTIHATSATASLITNNEYPGWKLYSYWNNTDSALEGTPLAVQQAFATWFQNSYMRPVLTDTWKDLSGWTTFVQSRRRTDTSGTSSNTCYGPDSAMGAQSLMYRTVAATGTTTTASPTTMGYGNQAVVRFAVIGGGAIQNVGSYRARTVFSPTNVTIDVGYFANDVFTSLNTTTSRVTDVAATDYKVKVETSGSGPTTVSAKIWPAVSPEPATWDVTASDSLGPQINGAFRVRHNVVAGGAVPRSMLIDQIDWTLPGPTGPDTAPANTVLPNIVGVPETGTSIRTDGGVWTGSPTPALSYQWKRSATSGGAYTNITGATASSYIPIADDETMYLKVTVTATNRAGNASATSSAAGPVAGAGNQAPIAYALAALTPGSPLVGQVITADPGGWQGTDPITFTYQWQNDRSGSYVNMVGVTSDTYTAVAADANHHLICIVTATNSVGTAQATAGPVLVQAQVSATTGEDKPSLSGLPQTAAVNTPNTGPVNAVDPAGGTTDQSQSVKDMVRVKSGTTDTLYFVGGFATVGGANHQRVAAFDLANDPPTLRTTFSPQIPLRTGQTGTDPELRDIIRTVAVSPDARWLYVGGSFDTVSGAAHNRLARINCVVGDANYGQADNTWNPSVDATVYALAVDTLGRVYVGGGFTSITTGATTVTRRGLARLDPTTGAPDSWNPDITASAAGGLGGSVRAIALHPDQSKNTVYAAGAFDTVAGVAGQKRVVQLAVDTGAKSSWNPGWSWTNAATGATSEAPQICYDCDLSPDGSYLVVATAGGTQTGGNSTFCWKPGTYSAPGANGRLWYHQSDGDNNGVGVSNSFVWAVHHGDGTQSTAFYPAGQAGKKKLYTVNLADGSLATTAAGAMWYPDTAFNSISGGYCVLVTSDALFVGGSFTTPDTGIAMFKGTTVAPPSTPAPPVPATGCYFGMWSKQTHASRYPAGVRSAFPASEDGEFDFIDNEIDPGSFAIAHYYKNLGSAVFVGATEQTWDRRTNSSTTAFDRFLWPNISEGGFTWAGVAAGNANTKIDQIIQECMDYGRPMFISFFGEPEGNVGGAGMTQLDFRAAQRFIIKRFRSKYQAAGKPINVAHCLVLQGQGRFQSGSPADALTNAHRAAASSFDFITLEADTGGAIMHDWMAPEPYNWYGRNASDGWDMFRALATPIKDFMSNTTTGTQQGAASSVTLDPRQMPIIFGEWGTMEDPANAARKGAWYTDATNGPLAVLTSPGFEMFKGMVYFNSMPPSEGVNWKFDSKPGENKQPANADDIGTAFSAGKFSFDPTGQSATGFKRMVNSQTNSSYWIKAATIGPPISTIQEPVFDSGPLDPDTNQSPSFSFHQPGPTASTIVQARVDGGAWNNVGSSGSSAVQNFTVPSPLATGQNHTCELRAFDTSTSNQSRTVGYSNVAGVATSVIGSPGGWFVEVTPPVVTLDAPVITSGPSMTTLSSTAAFTWIEAGGPAVLVPTIPIAPTAITLSGTLTVGSTLSHVHATWDNGPITSYRHQWARSTNSGLSYTDIAGATGNTYTLVAADATNTTTWIKVTEWASNAVGESTTSQSAVIGPISSGGGGGGGGGSITNTALPVVTVDSSLWNKLMTVGVRIVVSTGTWSTTPTNYAYQWQSDSSGSFANVPNTGANGGGTSSGYYIQPTDIGHNVRCVVTASITGSSASATTTSTACVNITGTYTALIQPLSWSGAPAGTLNQTLVDSAFTAGNAMYANSSYGAFQGWTATLRPVLNLSIAPPTDTVQSVDAIARPLLVSAGVDVTSYNHIQYVIASTATIYGGLSSLSTQLSYTTYSAWQATPIQGAVMAVFHEFGHDLGVHHGNALTKTGFHSVATGTDDEYGDRIDIMGQPVIGPNNAGNGPNLERFTVREADYYGWLGTRKAVVNLSTFTGSQTFTITTTGDQATTNKNGILITDSTLSEFVGTTADSFNQLWIEYRSSTTTSGPMPGWTDGIRLILGTTVGTNRHGYLVTCDTGAAPIDPSTGFPASSFNPTLKPGNSITTVGGHLRITCNSVNRTTDLASVTLTKL